MSFRVFVRLHAYEWDGKPRTAAASSTDNWWYRICSFDTNSRHKHHSRLKHIFLLKIWQLPTYYFQHCECSIITRKNNQKCGLNDSVLCRLIDKLIILLKRYIKSNVLLFHLRECVFCGSSLLDITPCLPLCSLSTSQHNHIPLKGSTKKEKGGKQREDFTEEVVKEKHSYFHYILPEANPIWFCLFKPCIKTWT